MKNSDDNKSDNEVFVPERLQPESSGSGTLGLLLILLLGALIVIGGFGLIFVKTVTLAPNPAGSQIEHINGVSLLHGNKLYGFAGAHELEISAPGYEKRTVTILFDGELPSALPVSLDELPGEVTFELVGPKVGDLYIDDTFVQEIAGEPVKIARGNVRYRIEHPRYLPASGTLDVAGLGVVQTVPVELVPNWRSVTLTSAPSGASVFHEDRLIGQTPLVVDLVPELYLLTYRKDGYADERRLMEIELGPDLIEDTVSLSPTGGTLLITSDPPGARVLIDGTYAGVSPLRHPVAADRNYQVLVEKEGYDSWSGTGSAGASRTTHIDAGLTQQFGTVKFDSTPKAAVFIDGVSHGLVPVEARLPAGDHAIEFRLSGYRTVSQLVPVRKDDDRQVEVKLKTEKAARYAEAKPVYSNVAGMTMVLAKPTAFIMGAPRGEPGQMANEIQKKVKLERWFYIAESEVNHRHFTGFLKEMGEGLPGLRVTVPTDLDMPVTGVKWDIAALYCNWLSAREGLAEAYRIKGGRIVLDTSSIGYRLPTEAEWEWAARVAARPKMPLLKYPWGNRPTVPSGAGNFAGKEASATLPHRIPNYSDGFSDAAPVKSFGPNPLGLYDLGGNVSEWVNDFYGIVPVKPGEVLLDPVGPEDGLDHVVKGSSWKSGNETELRFSFRTFNEGSADHIGFRIGRWVH